MTLFNFVGSSKPKDVGERAAAQEVRALRDDVAADVVAVLCDLEDKSTSGISYAFTKDCLSAKGLSNLAEMAYCVCDVSSLQPRFTLLHELGHIFGAGHDDEQRSNPGPQLKSYSSGYQFSYGGENHTTVMGTVVSRGRKFIRWPFFSSPLYMFGMDGPIVGTARLHDNSRTLRETYPIVANFRVTTPLPPPPAIGVAVERLSDSDSEALEVVADMATVRAMRYVDETFRISTSPSNDSSKTSISVKGLPVGMKYSSKTGLITGYPKKCGTSVVKVSATGKGLKTESLQFTLQVDSVPSSLYGKYVGLMEVGGTCSVMTLNIGSSGKTTLKGKVDGRSRTFSVYGLSDALYDETGGLAFTVEPGGKIGRKPYKFAFRAADRVAEIFDGESCVLRQVPWGRKDCAAPKFRKTLTIETDGWQCKMKSNGKVFVSGKPTGTTFSGTFQLVPADEEALCASSAQYLLPISFPSKKVGRRKHDGFSGVLRFILTIDGNGNVTEASSAPYAEGASQSRGE